MKENARSRARLTVVATAEPQAPEAVTAAALRAFHRADYGAVEELLDIAAPAPAAVRAHRELLRARIARARGDLDRWHESASYAARHLADPHRLGAVALRAGVARRQGNASLADGLAAEVERDLARGTGDAEGLAAYVLAVDAWEARRYDDAERLIARNVEAGVRLVESHGLRAWIAVRRERYREAGTHFGRALSALERENVDARARARVIHGALLIAGDVVDLRLGRRARAAYEKMAPEWPASLALERFNSEGQLRIIALLEGDMDAAYAHGRNAVVYAPTLAFAARAELDCVTTAEMLGDRGAYALQLRRAWAHIRDATWVVDEEQRLSLTAFALQAATTMPAEARKAITLYRSLRKKAKPENALEDDRRVEAFDLWAAGRIGEILGKRDDAIASYRASLELFSTLDYIGHAAWVSLDLERLAGGDVHREPISAVLRRAPKAWIGSRLEDPIPALGELRRPQLEVLVRLLEGFSAKAIAEDLERSHFTVINHTRKVFAAFDVHSRDDLFRACRAAGVTPELVRERLTKGRPTR